MLQLTYGSGWRETSHLRPEHFTQLAPEGLQRECWWQSFWPCHLWDTSLYGHPRFRLALVSSRFTLSGGHVVTIKDAQGNIRSTAPAVVQYPLYHVPEPFYGCYVLEMWRPAAWWYAQGFGSKRAVEYSEFGKGIRAMEPVWPEGNWLGIMNGANPFCATRDVSTDLVRWMIHVVKLRFEATNLQIAKLARERSNAADAQEKKDVLEALRSRRPTMPGPMVAIPAAVN